MSPHRKNETNHKTLRAYGKRSKEFFDCDLRNKKNNVFSIRGITDTNALKVANLDSKISNLTIPWPHRFNLFTYTQDERWKVKCKHMSKWLFY